MNLGTSISGMNATQRQLEIVSLNVANASTKGYTKKSLLQSTNVLPGVGGVGVVLGQVERSFDKSLFNDLQRQNSKAASADVGESYLSRIQQLFGTPDSEQSFAASIAKLKSGFVALSSDPGSGVRQSEVVGKAQSLATKFSSMSANIQNLRGNAENQIQDETNQMNILAQNIADTNLAISTAKNRGENPVDLMDKRDQYIQELSQYVNITTYDSGDGTLVVQTSRGSVIADKTARAFSFATSPLDYGSYYPASANGIILDGRDVTAEITSGSMGRLFDLRDNVLPAAQAMMDEAAHKMALRFQAQGVKLFTDAAGNVPTDVVANYIGFSAKITVNPAVVSNPALLKDGTGGTTLNDGDNSNVLKVVDYAFGDFADAAQTAHTAFRTANLGPNGSLSVNLPTNGNIINYANSLIAKQSQDYSLIKGQKDYEGAYQETLSKKDQDQNHVSIDDEMANLITLQKVYAANAKAFSTASDMFDLLVQSIR